MAKTLNCVVVTPETTALEAQAEFVALPLYDGEIGIAPDHSPLIGRLGYGEMRLRQGNQVTTYYVDGGFVQVADNVVSVLTNRAVPARSVDPSAAERQLDDALRRPTVTADQSAVRDRLISQARAQIRVARRARS